MQFELVALLKAGLADTFRALVVGRLFFGLDQIEILLVDPVDVTDDVRRRRPERVVAEEARLHINAREKIAVSRKARDLFISEPRPDRDTLERFALFEQLLEAPAILGLDIDVLADRVDRRVKILDLGRRNLEREGRVIARQNNPVAILDDATIRRDRHERDAVVLGARDVVVVLDDLQEEETPDQQAETDDHRGCGDEDARAKAVEVRVTRVEGHVAAAHDERPQMGRLASRLTG
jgi:hypothetical protein